MIDIKVAESFFGVLDGLSINYFVSGGFGVDGIRGQMTKPHNDIDLYVFAEQLDLMFAKLKEKGYRCFKNLNKYEVQNQGIKIDVLPLQDKGKYRVLYGNAADTRFPKQIFLTHQPGRIDSLSFKVVPNEVFALELPYSKYKDDKEFCTSLNYDKGLFSEIENTQKKKPSHITLEEI